MSPTTLSTDPQKPEVLRKQLQEQYDTFKARGRSLDLTRGKPCPEQLDLAMGMLSCVNVDHYKTRNGTDCRNYGGLDGIAEAKALMADFLEVAPDEVIIGGNSSLNLMYDTILRAMVKGVGEQAPPWASLSPVTFLCPSPGYDRHFHICQNLGIRMIPIEMGPDGPDMDSIEARVADDESIKGIWCVPRYSNPTGAVYSHETVWRLASMPAKARDFRIFWDNAYAHHHLVEDPRPLANILNACNQAGHPERVYLFGSTSKISFAGAGMAAMAASRKNIAFVKKEMSFQSIGPDKLNQLRHVLFFKDMEGIRRHMQKHAEILKPKFDAVERVLADRLAGKQIATWSRPHGGYFVNFDAPDGCARKIVKSAADAGVKLTPAGATYPYGQDPRDRNIRIAPTFATVAEIEPAMELLAICTRLIALEEAEKRR